MGALLERSSTCISMSDRMPTHMALTWSMNGSPRRRTVVLPLPLADRQTGKADRQTEHFMLRGEAMSLVA